MGHKTHNGSQSAFTLIELLASMAVLVILMIAMTRVFTEASSAFKKGSTTVMRNSAAEVAMEIMTHDLEGLVVNERLAMLQRANYADATGIGFGFDDLWFITSASDQDDDSHYQLVRYYVATVTNQGLVISRRFQLKRATWNVSLTDKDFNNPRSPANKEWWTKMLPNAEEITLVDNLVRFDVYLHNANGQLMQGTITAGGTYAGFNSNLGYSGVTNQPPAAIDIYLQVTSDESASQGGANLLYTGAGEADVWKKGRSLMYRDSNVLTTRIFPAVAAGEWAHPMKYWYPQ